MIVELLTEITLLGVYERGVPNEEHLLLKLNSTLDLGQYGVMAGVKAGGASAIPVNDNLYWFGDANLNAGDWVFLYTGPGTARSSKLPNSENVMYSIHWGRKETIFHSENIVPILFRSDAVTVNTEITTPTKKVPTIENKLKDEFGLNKQSK